MGMTPARLVSPVVGLMPTTALKAAGQRIEPAVSVPRAPGAKPAATAVAEPELEPHGDRSRTYGLSAWPPRALQPLEEWVERKLAHSLILALPRSTAPAVRRRAATVASRAG